MPATYDAIIIGTGQSGPSLAGRLTASRPSVAVVERKRFGGTCVNTGCIPTKTLVASAQAAHVARRAAEFGVALEGPVRVDMKRGQGAQGRVVRLSNEGVEELAARTWRTARSIAAMPASSGRRRSSVGDELLEAEQDLHQRRRPRRRPAIPGIDDGPLPHQLLMMAVDFLPEHLVILGGSYIGLEFGADVPPLRQRGDDHRAQRRG